MKDTGPHDMDDIAMKTLEIDKSIKETRLRMRPNTVGSGTLIVRKYGTSHVLEHIAESCGLKEDLEKAYGSAGDCILATAISMVQSSAYPISTEEEMGENFSCESLGIADRFHPSMIEELLDRVGSDAEGRGEFFRRRVSRASHIYSYDSYIVGENGTDNLEDSDFAIMFETDFDGVPVHFTIDTYGSLRNMEIIDHMRIARELGAKKCTYVFEHTFPGNSERLARLIERGAEFISMALPDTECAKTVAKRIDDGERHVRNGRTYLVHTEAASVVAKRIRNQPDTPQKTDDTDKMAIVLDDDSRFHVTRLDSRIRVWGYRPEDDDVESPERIEARIAVIERHLRKIGPAEAIRQFEEVAGRYARFFNITMTDGKLDLSVKREDLELLFNRNTVVYSKGFETWEEMMDCLEGGNTFDDGLAMIREALRMDRANLLDHRELGTSMMRFVALILWCEMKNRLESAGYDVPIPTAIRWLDTVLVKGDGMTWQIVGLTPRTRSILAALDASISKNTITISSDCRP